MPPPLRLRLLIAAATAAILSACAVPPRAAAPDAETCAVDSAYFRADPVRIHRISVNGGTIPEHAWLAALATIERHLGRRIQVFDDGDLPLAPDQPPDTRLAVAAIVYSSAPDPPPPPGITRPQHPIAGITGVFAEKGGALTPITDPATILVMVINDEPPTGYAGYTRRVMRLTEPGDGVVPAPGLVVLRQSAIRHRAGPLVSQEKLWQWTLTHEIGHVLRVPADRSHVCYPEGYSGRHCTHPECVMYTGIDWRVILSGLLHGWPLDFCDRCAAELKSARDAAAGTPPPPAAP